MKKSKTECIFELATDKICQGGQKKVKDCNFGIKKTTMFVDDNLQKKIALASGHYAYFDFDDILIFDIKAQQYLASLLTKQILTLEKINKITANKILVVGLGNAKYACDSLGSSVANKILVTTPYLDKKLFEPKDMARIYSLSFGVYGTTGIDSSQMICQICKLIEPDLVIAIDSLVASNAKSLSHSIQMSDTKLSPGGGVGNQRQDLSSETLGTHVFAIGVPLVVNLGKKGGEEDLIVTSKDIEKHISVLSKIIATAINKSFVFLPNDDYLQLVS